MARSYIQSLGDGTNRIFSIPFPYLSKAHVTVSVAGVSVPFTWITSGSIQTDTAPAAGAVVDRRRNSNLDAIAVDFNDGSTLVETDLDLSALQSFYLIQEAYDVASANIGLSIDGTIDAEVHRVSRVADPVNAQDAATKAYVDLYTSAAIASGSSAAASAAAAAISASQAAASAVLAATFDPNDYYTKTVIDDSFNTRDTAIAAKLPLAGGTMTGDLNLGTRKISNGLIVAGSSTLFADSTDNTKKLQLSLPAIPSGQTRQLIMPDKDITLKDSAWEVIQSVIISGNPSVIDFTNLGAYEFLRVSGYCWGTVNNSTLSALLSTNNGSTYPSGANDYFTAYTYTSSGGTPQAGYNFQPAMLFGIGGCGTTNQYQHSFNAEISGFNKAVNTYARVQTISRQTAGYIHANVGINADVLGAVSCNALRLLLAAGTFAGGTIKLEGIKG